MSSYLTFSPLPENRRLFSAALAVSLAAAFLLGSMAAQCCPDFPLLCSDSPGHPFKVKINRHLRRCLRVSASVTYKSTLPSSSPLAALHLPIYFNFKPVSSKRPNGHLPNSITFKAAKIQRFAIMHPIMFLLLASAKAND